MSDRLRWGLLAVGNIAKNFAKGVSHSKTGVLEACASRSLDKAEAFAKEFGVARAIEGYDALLADGDVDAVYISTPHPMHVAWAIKAAEAGKHVLCEKPLGLHRGEAMGAIEAARRHGVFFMEAFMYRCNPLTRRYVELIREGRIGQVKMIEASFGFKGGRNLEGRLFNNALGGGGILDVGCYPASAACLIAGAGLAGDRSLAPRQVRGAGIVPSDSRVDEFASASLLFEHEGEQVAAQISTSVGAALSNGITVHGTEGRMHIASPWFCTGHEGGEATITIQSGRETEEIVVQTDAWLYGLEADTLAEAVAAGRTEAAWPAMTWVDSEIVAGVTDRWRDEVGCQYDAEQPDRLETLHRRPLQRKTDHRMRYGRVEGVDKDISLLVHGVDNHHDARVTFAQYDDFFEQGGNCWDTAWLYGKPRSVQFGQWVARRGVRDAVNVIIKPGHHPWNFPDRIEKQVHEQLEWLGFEHAELCFLHRDNTDVPAGEFVDALDALARAGKIKAFGGSNWTLQRIEEANAYAAAHGKQGFTANSNNLSLARMVDPVWSGCVHVSDDASLAWHAEKGMPNFSWSSQARGFFVPGRFDPGDIEAAQRMDAQLVRCWVDDENLARLERAKELAAKHGVSPINIALAYVLAQPFPSFALIGPRTMNELWTSLPGLDVTLSAEEIDYLQHG